MVRKDITLKRVLFFITSLAGGGAEKVLVNMVNHMDKRKFHVTIMTLFDVGVNKEFLSKEIEYKYVFKKVIRGNSKLFKLFSPEYLYKHMIKDDYDVIVSYFQGPTTRIVAGCPNKNTKLVQWIHNEFHSKERIAVCYRNINECILLQKKFDATVYVSKTVRDIYLNTFPEIKKNDFVLYNTVESDEILSLSQEEIKEKELFNADINLVSVGRLVPQKSFERLLSIVSKIHNAGYDVKLLLLGTGEKEQELKKIARDLQIENIISFLGYKKNPYKYVKNADLFVCSSLYEGFSTAVTESLIVGTPVVTTLCSGMKELLGDNEFGLITDNDKQALLKGILNLLNDRQLLLHYKRKAIERGLMFDAQKTTAAVERFFEEL